jgi:hypothetical protein
VVFSPDGELMAGRSGQNRPQDGYYADTEAQSLDDSGSPHKHGVQSMIVGLFHSLYFQLAAHLVAEHVPGYSSDKSFIDLHLYQELAAGQ